MRYFYLFLYLQSVFSVVISGSSSFQAKRYNKIAHENLHRLPKRQHNNITVGVNATDGVHVTDNEPPPHNIYLGGWVAFGDSFSAGPGAGARDPSPNSERCKRNVGAYPRQLNDDPRFVNWFGSPAFAFLSCTGHVTTQVENEQIVPFGERLLHAGLVTLSIGGNDVKFSDMVKACIAGLRGYDCEKAINTGRELLYSEVFPKYGSMMELMQERLDWCNNDGTGTGRRRYDCETLVYQTAYPSFFESYTEQCDGVNFRPPGIPNGPKITRDIRTKLNQLTQELNTLVAYMIADINYIQRERLFPNHPSDRTLPDFMRFVDQGDRYTGHRFCRQDVDEPDPSNEQTWFFNLDWSGGEESISSNGTALTPLGPASDYRAINPKTCQGTDEMGQVLACGIAQSVVNGSLSPDTPVPRYIPAGPGRSPNDTVSINDWLSKTFHPKTPGFSATKDELMQRLDYVPPFTRDRGCPTLTGLNLRILPIGDEITLGFASGRINDYNGFLGSLELNMLEARVGHRDCYPNQWRWVGTQRLTEGGGRVRAEAYAHQTINGIKAQMVRSENSWKSERPNLIILTAGTNDLLQGRDPADVAEDLDGFISWLNLNLPGTTILVQHIPPLGPFIQPGRHEISDLQKNVIKYNAAISTITDTKRAQRNGKGIYKVHAVTALNDRVGSNHELPNAIAYSLMADAISERITDIREDIEDPSQILSTPSSNFSCEYSNFANPATAIDGSCSAAVISGWCVCDSQTYGVMSTGGNACGYTAPPPTGTTTLCPSPSTTSSTTLATSSTSSPAPTSGNPNECGIDSGGPGCIAVPPT